MYICDCDVKASQHSGFLSTYPGLVCVVEVKFSSPAKNMQSWEPSGATIRITEEANVSQFLGWQREHVNIELEKGLLLTFSPQQNHKIPW